MTYIPHHVHPIVRAEVQASPMSSIRHPLAFVDIPSVRVYHLPHAVAFPIRPEAGVDTPVGVPAFAESVSFVVDEAAVVTTSVGVGHDTSPMAEASGISFASVGILIGMSLVLILVLFSGHVS